MSIATRMYAALLFVVVAPLVTVAVDEHRHTCLKHSTRRVFVEEYTTYLNIPITTPAHIER